MKSLLLVWAMSFIAVSIKFDEWYIFMPCIGIGYILVEIYHGVK